MSAHKGELRILPDRLIHLVSRRGILSLPIRAGRPLSVFIRAVDAGSDGAAELAIAALMNPIYDFERFGFKIVASPRHADVLLLTGPCTRSMQEAVLAAFTAMPEPRRVVTVGDGFTDGNAFTNAYAVVPLPPALAAATVAHVPGDPPHPQAILDALLALAGDSS
jgi:Ni,Fe-hydrogenase III small subunit